MVRTKSEELVSWDREHIARSMYPVGQSRGIVIEKGEGVRFYDINGKEYIDGASQLLCVNLGWGRQEIIDAVKAQVEKLQYSTMFFGFSNSAVVECARQLAELTPEGLDHFIFTSGGSEGNEVAFKIARQYNIARGSRKYKVISMADSYHGVTMGAGAATGVGKGFFEAGLMPVPGHLRIPSYYCYRCAFGKEYPVCDIECARFLGKVIEKEGAGTVAAFIGEPVLGVGGCIAPPPEYWPMVRQICDELDVLLIADEVMTGFCRTGKMFALEHWSIKPDIMVMAKGITSSYIPFGAVAFTERINGALKSGNAMLSAFTFGGHPVGAAAATAAMRIYVKDKVADHVAEVGKYALNRLNADFKPLPCVDFISGLGLMLSMEIVADKASRKPFDPSLKILPGIQNKALEHGLWIRISNIAAGPGDRIPFAPPLIASKEDVDRCLDILYPLLSSLKPS